MATRKPEWLKLDEEAEKLSTQLDEMYNRVSDLRCAFEAKYTVNGYSKSSQCVLDVHDTPEHIINTT